MEHTTGTTSDTGDRPVRMSITVGGLLLAAIALVAWFQRSEIQAVRAELKTLSDRQAAGISSLEKEVRQALGYVIVEDAPPELAVAVRAAVDRWLPGTGGQGIPVSSEEIRADIAFLEQSMGTGLDQAFRSEIRLLSWWADTVDLHHAVGNQFERAPSVYEWAQSLRLSAPLRAPKWSFDVVLAAERKASIEIARLAVSKPFTNSEEIDAALAILAQLGRELGSDAPAFIIEERQRLVAKGKELEDQSLGEVLSALTTQRATAIKSAGTERIKLQVQAGFDGQIMGVLSSMGDVTPSRRKEVETLVQAWQAETRALENRLHQDEMLRYQIWALKQIDDFEKRIPGCQGIIDDSESCMREKFVEYLVPVDTNLLLPPVQEKFTEVWNNWKPQLGEVENSKLLQNLGQTAKKGLGEV